MRAHTAAAHALFYDGTLATSAATSGRAAAAIVSAADASRATVRPSSLPMASAYSSTHVATLSSATRMPWSSDGAAPSRHVLTGGILEAVSISTCAPAHTRPPAQGETKRRNQA